MTDKRKFLLRIDEDLWNDLQAWAGDELRSVNGQIEYLLRQAVRTRRKSRADGQNEHEPDNAPEECPKKSILYIEGSRFETRKQG